jgi:hypothetical protein
MEKKKKKKKFSFLKMLGVNGRKATAADKNKNKFNVGNAQDAIRNRKKILESIE